MNFIRQYDLDWVYLCLTHQAHYDLIGDDFMPPAEEFRVNNHPDIWYLAVCNSEGLIGMFTLVPDSPICWQVHVVMLPWAPKADKMRSARELIPWLAKHTECRRLTAAVPALHEKAIAYGTHGLGMHIVGRHEKAFLKHGELHDLVLMGRAIGG